MATSFIAASSKSLCTWRASAPGKVIAELKFAFWVGLVGPQYDATIWRKCLYKAFRSVGGKRRKDIHSRLNALRRFRNRIAHHEPIFHKPIKVTHIEVIETVRWMCRHAAAWAGKETGLIWRALTRANAGNGMCEKCADIDKKIELLRR